MLRPRSVSGKVLAGLAASVAALMLAGYAVALRPQGEPGAVSWTLAGGSGALVLLGLMVWAAAAVQVWRRNGR